MNLKCFFRGHKIIKGICQQCGKTLCEIKGHEWIYSDLLYTSGCQLYNQQKCKRCNIEQGRSGKHWMRTK